MSTQKIPTTKAGIDALVRKMRNNKAYDYRIPSDTEIRRQANTRHQYRLGHKLDREFPAPDAFHHRCLIESQSPLMTVNLGDEPDAHEPEFQLSSRGLTDWYVGEFNKLNHFK